jgi:hypothetical protein
MSSCCIHDGSGRFLKVRLGHEPMIGDRLAKGREVAVILIGISFGKSCEGLVGHFATAEVTGNRDSISRAGVGARQRMSARPAIVGQQ